MTTGFAEGGGWGAGDRPSSCSWPLSGPQVPRSRPEKLEPLWIVRVVPEPLSTKTETYCPACRHPTVDVTTHGTRLPRGNVRRMQLKPHHAAPAPGVAWLMLGSARSMLWA